MRHPAKKNLLTAQYFRRTDLHNQKSISIFTEAITRQHPRILLNYQTNFFFSSTFPVKTQAKIPVRFICNPQPLKLK